MSKMRFERMRLAKPCTREDERRARELEPFAGRDLTGLTAQERRGVLMNLLPVAEADLLLLEDILDHPKHRRLHR